MVSSFGGKIIDEASFRGDKTSIQTISSGSTGDVLRDPTLAENEQLVYFQGQGADFKVRLNSDTEGHIYYENETIGIIFNPTLTKIVVENLGSGDLKLVIWRGGKNGNI